MKSKARVSNKKCKPIVRVDRNTGVKSALYDMTSFQEVDYNEKVEEWKQKVCKPIKVFNTTENEELNNAEKVADIVNTAITRISDVSEKELENPKDFVILLRSVKKEKYWEVELSEENIEDAVNSLLLKTYSKDGMKQSVFLLLCSAFVRVQKESGLQYRYLTEPQMKIIKSVFLSKLKHFFYLQQKRKKQVEEIPLSLKNQNLVVQPDSTGRLVIANTPSSNIRKQQEKDALRAFLYNYASLNESKRDDLRIRLQNLVYLYVLGAEYFDILNGDKEQYLEENKSQLFVEYIVEFEKEGKEYPNISEMRKSIRKKSMDCYRSSMDYVSRKKTPFFMEDQINAFWIHHIENEIERIYRKKRKGWKELYTNGYIIDKVEEGIKNYLCNKYIAIGKAVYHYAMQMVNIESDQKLLEFGAIDEKYLKGISSLEYEQIAAEERFQRICAVYLTFACNYLANEAVNLDENNSDFLFLKRYKQKGKKTLDELAKPGVLRNVLQFFGGLSTWDHFFDGVDEIVFLDDIRKCLYAFRNNTFHFASKNHNQQWDMDLIGRMFERECTGEIQRIQAFAVECCNYYPTSSVISCLDSLYAENKKRKRIRVRFVDVINDSNINEVISEINPVQICRDDPIYGEWRNTLKRLLDRIYERAFLDDEKSVDIFGKCLKEKSANDKSLLVQQLIRIYEEKENDDSISNTYGRILAAVNSKVNVKKEIRIDNAIKTSKDILRTAIKEAFLTYLKVNSDIYGFINYPEFRNTQEFEGTAVESYHFHQYDDLMNKVKNSSELQQWYVLGRLLTVHQLDAFEKDIERYAGYAIKVGKKARLVGNEFSSSTSTVTDYEYVFQILDLCKEWNGRITGRVLDYFESTDDYANYLMKYVDFAVLGEETPTEALKRFCSYEADGEPIGLYYDEYGPKLNRNIVLGKIYGAAEMENVTSLKMNYDTILDYKKVSKERLNDLSKKDKIIIEAKYKLLRMVRDLRFDAEVSEIFYELQGKLISWVFLRERDLMYFQLGFHYMCIKNDAPKPAGYDCIGNYKGVILYQIVAMYTNGMPLIGKDGKLDHSSMSNETSVKLTEVFIPYTEDMTEKEDGIYVAGLELFEDVKQHTKYINLRNNIVHFHYSIENFMSVFDVFNEMYYYFLRYDARYTSHIVEGIKWILQKHGIISSITFQQSDVEEKGKNKKCYQMGLRPENGLFSIDRSLFPIQDNKVIDSVKAYYIEYLRGIATMLYSPHPVPEKFWGEPRDKQKR